jgi:hypothetical protein
MAAATRAAERDPRAGTILERLRRRRCRRAPTCGPIYVAVTLMRLGETPRRRSNCARSSRGQGRASTPTAQCPALARHRLARWASSQCRPGDRSAASTSSAFPSGPRRQRLQVLSRPPANSLDRRWHRRRATGDRSQVAATAAMGSQSASHRVAANAAGEIQPDRARPTPAPAHDPTACDATRTTSSVPGSMLTRPCRE